MLLDRWVMIVDVEPAVRARLDQSQRKTARAAGANALAGLDFLVNSQWEAGRWPEVVIDTPTNDESRGKRLRRSYDHLRAVWGCTRARPRR